MVQCPGAVSREFDVEGWVDGAAFCGFVVQCPESLMLKYVCMVQSPEFDVEV